MTACLWLTFCALVLWLTLRGKFRAYRQQRVVTECAQRALADLQNPRTAAARRRLGFIHGRESR